MNERKIAEELTDQWDMHDVRGSCYIDCQTLIKLDERIESALKAYGDGREKKTWEAAAEKTGNSTCGGPDLCCNCTFNLTEEFRAKAKKVGG